MYSGISLYEIKNTDPQEILNFATGFFNETGLPVTNVSYKLAEKSGNIEEADYTEISLTELLELIRYKNISYRLCSTEKHFPPWIASFGCTWNDCNECCCIDMQYPSDIYDDIYNFIKKMTGMVTFNYGIGYCFPKCSDAFLYSSASGVCRLYDYENTSAFKKLFFKSRNHNTVTQYDHLRMVYQYNILNKNHLSLSVAGLTLKEWIIRENAGRLEEVFNAMWLWIVNNNDIERINKYLGEQGILISWDIVQTKSPVRKLP